MTTWTDADSRQLTITFVAHDGHNMPLRGDDRAAAIRAMLALRLDVTTIAQRLCIDDVESLRTWCRRRGITLPPTNPPQPWWVVASCPSASSRNRRRQKQAQRARTTATTGSC